MVLGAVVLAVVAGALGAGVADRLDPYGADDPATESVRANDLLEGAGYQELGVIALLEHADVHSAATRRRVAELRNEISRDPAVGRVLDYYNTGSHDFVGRDSTYLAVHLAVDRRQGAAGRRQADRRPPRRRAGRRRSAAGPSPSSR